MTPRLQAVLFLSLFFICAAGLAWAQPGDEPAKTDKDAKKEAPRGDPTVPSPKLKELLYPEKVGKPSATGPGPKMPKLELRGRVVLKDQPAVALLDVDGKMFLVGKGSSLPAANSTMLRVIDVNTLEVRIEVLPFKEIVVLR